MVYRGVTEHDCDVMTASPPPIGPEVTEAYDDVTSSSLPIGQTCSVAHPDTEEGCVGPAEFQVWYIDVSMDGYEEYCGIVGMCGWRSGRVGWCVCGLE